MMIPCLPGWLMDNENLSSLETGIAMGVFGLGLYLFGSLCSYLVQRFRRNVVCIVSILCVVGCQALLYYADTLKGEFIEFSVILLQRLMLGAFFGLAQMVIGSTLIIDSCESFQRTEANHSAAWFSRFALACGPLCSILLLRTTGFDTVLMGSMICAALSVIFIRLVSFPFRTPEEHQRIFCLDRFFLTHGTLLYINLILVTTVIGLLMTIALNELFYGMMIVGFLLAMLAQRFVFRDAELKSEIVTGLICIGVAILLCLTRSQHVVDLISPAFIGFGIGIIGSRFLLFFIKLSRHCQRGTSQSTYLLGWESGLSLGLGIGYALLYGEEVILMIVALVLTITSLAMYHLLTHQWFITHKNR